MEKFFIVLFKGIMDIGSIKVEVFGTTIKLYWICGSFVVLNAIACFMYQRGEE